MPSTSGAHTTAKGTLRFGLTTSKGKFLSVKNTADEADTKTFLVDPAGHKVKRVYICADDPDTCKPVDALGWTSLADKGIMNGDKVEVIPAIVIAETKGSKLTPGFLDFACVPVEQIEGQLWASGSALWFEPDATDDVAYAVFCEMAADPTKALIGTMNLRNNDKTYRAFPHQGGIIVQESLRPSEVHSFTAVKRPLTEAERKMAEQMLEAFTDDFHPEDFASDRVAAMREVIANAGGGTITPITKAKGKAAPVDDVMAQMMASMELARAKKAQREAS